MRFSGNDQDPPAYQTPDFPLRQGQHRRWTPILRNFRFLKCINKVQLEKINVLQGLLHQLGRMQEGMQ